MTQRSKFFLVFPLQFYVNCIFTQPGISSCIYDTYLVTVQEVCALAALTVRKHRLEGKNPISEADLEWIFARNYEGTE